MIRCVYCGRERVEWVNVCKRCGNRQAVYEPAADEIKAACAKIQAGWSAADECTRRGECIRDHYEVPAVLRWPCGRRINNFDKAD